MTRIQKFGFLMIALCPLIVIVSEYVAHQIEMSEQVDEIEAETKARLRALGKAHSMVVAKIQNGDYAETELDRLEEDFKFFKIVARFED